MNQPYGDCKNDPLHTMGMIQSHGALIAFNVTDHKSIFFSENTGEILGLESSKILGVPGVELFPHDWTRMTEVAERRGYFYLSGNFPSTLIVAVHQQGGRYIMEFEPADSADEHWWNYAERIEFLERLENAKTVNDCRRLIVRYLFEHIGFDRIMLYEFEPDMHGSVVEERVTNGADSFLGLHFPAEDIPPNAQVFYTRNWQRLIADVDSVNVPLVGRSAPPETLDLTCAMLRAVHPVHLQYLKNMKVQASFSLSLLIKGALYGMVACHHSKPRVVDLADRLAYEEIARLVSLHMENLIAVGQRDMKAVMGQKLADLKEKLHELPGGTGVSIAQLLGPIQELLEANAAWLHYNGEDYYSGPVPQKDSLERVQDWLGSLSTDSIVSYASIPEALGKDVPLVSQASGLIYVPLTDRNFLTFFRPEVIQNITWAGRPEQDENEPLTPRSSFKAWKEQKRGTTTPWTEIELEYAEKLRTILLKYDKQPSFE